MCLFLFSTCFRRLCAHHQEKQLYLCDTWYLLFCMDDCLVCRVHAAYNKYQVLHQYGCFSGWWAHSRPKHVEKGNGHTKKNCAPRWLYLQDYTGMHGQQNIKYKTNLLNFLVDWLILMLPIHNGLCLNLGLKTRYSKCFHSLSLCSRRMPEYCLNSVPVASSSVHIPSNLLFANSPTV